MNIEIANRLVVLRKQSGLSQEDVAEKLGISCEAVSKWERAESAPDIDNLIRISKIYHVSLDALLNTDGASTSGTSYASQNNQYTVIKDSKITKEQDTTTKKKVTAFPYHILVVILYLFMGFSFDLWHPGWIIFLTIPLAEYFTRR